MCATDFTPDWFESRLLKLPRADSLNSVDLIRVIARRCGAPGFDLPDHAAELDAAIGEGRHLVFVVLDGMGSEQLAESPGCAFLKDNVSFHVGSVFPSTTAAALTTFATARWPGDHGVLSWWMYLPDRDLSVTTIPFVERFTERPLAELGIDPAAVYTSAGILDTFTCAAASLLPIKYTDTAYSRFASAETSRIGYESVEHAMELVATLCRDAKEPTFTYLYLPQYDALCHDHGTGHDRPRAALTAMSDALARLRTGLPEDASLVVTADHGLVDVPEEDACILEEGDPLLDMLRCPPTGEARTPFLHVREGNLDVFRERFDERFGSRFALVAPAEAERLGLFGPPPYSRAARARLGDWIAIAPRPTCLEYRGGGGEGRFAGFHGGLSAREMTVPVIIC